MKKLIVINGTMGAGKSSVCRELAKLLDRNVWLDGDWCWKMTPFAVSSQTKQMVIGNIRYLLRSFLNCTEFDYIIFCWVMHEQAIMEDVLEGIVQDECQIYKISLICSPEELQRRILEDVRSGRREPGVLERSLQRLPLYQKMDTIRFDTTLVSASDAARRIANLVTESAERLTI